MIRTVSLMIKASPNGGALLAHCAKKEAARSDSLLRMSYFGFTEVDKRPESERRRLHPNGVRTMCYSNYG
jgi:hypothetical protein